MPKSFFDLDRQALEIASRKVKTCNRTDRIQKVAGLMLEKPAYRRLPVLYKGKFYGIVTITDVLEFLCRKAPTLSSPISRIAETDVVKLSRKDSVKKALRTMDRRNLGGCPIVDGKELLGMVSESDFARMIDRRTGKKVEEAMSHPAVVRGHWPVRDVAQIMCRGAFRRMPVVEKGILLGMVAPYDILRHLDRKSRLGKLHSEKTPVSRILGTKLATIGPKADIRQAVERMEKNGVGGLPVEEDQELLGLITERDILEVMA